MNCRALIDKLNEQKSLSHIEWCSLISGHDGEDREYAAKLARDIADKMFGKKIYLRGLIEFSNICKNDCLYCGIRCSNQNASRYRLSEDEILTCCAEGHRLGFRTFVLQSGEDGYWNDGRMTELVKEIKTRYPDCAVTLSMGERSRESYEALFRGGADRYLLRHETADKDHYCRLHPENMSFDNRMRCLRDLKDIGFQTGCGMMTGSPFQTAEALAKDMEFICGFKPAMVGLGPFVPHNDTPFAGYRAGSVELTLFMLSLVRITLPDVLLPATTALGTVDPLGREKGIMAGANVLMPNLSPSDVRKKYMLYDNKICTGDEAAQCIECLKRRVLTIGYEIVTDRGDHRNYISKSI
ncbi:MAG: [FeFe] hydrogenase H-cluster radical SAM maturase HydE [Clostridiales bacterium]|nr:[FeFe] hydrogenase H-cluster radical SAM maturase HydE [Clostridiales bacterium]